jgi:hypothetical protein
MSERGPYKQKADIPPPGGAKESIQVHWDIMINNPDKGERRAAKRLLRKMGVTEAANVDVDRATPVMHKEKFKRPQTEKQKARSQAFFNRDKDTSESTIPSSNSSATLPDATVEAPATDSSTVGKGFTGSWFEMPRPIWDAEPQANVVFTLAEARAKGHVVQIGAGMYQGCNRYKVSDGAPWIVCREEGAPAKPMPSPRPSIADLYARSQPKRHSGCPDWSGQPGTHCNSPRCTGACGGF